MPRLEEVDMATSLQLEKDEATVNASNDGPTRLGYREASSYKPSQKLPLLTRGKTRCLPSRTMSGLSLLVMNLTRTSTLKIMR